MPAMELRLEILLVLFALIGRMSLTKQSHIYLRRSGKKLFDWFDVFYGDTFSCVKECLQRRKCIGYTTFEQPSRCNLYAKIVDREVTVYKHDDMYYIRQWPSVSRHVT